jgi:hypothetical protein
MLGCIHHHQLVALGIVAAEQHYNAKASPRQLGEDAVPQRLDHLAIDREREAVRQRGDWPPRGWQQHAAAAPHSALGHCLGGKAVQAKGQMWAMPFQRAPGHIRHRRGGDDRLQLGGT